MERGVASAACRDVALKRRRWKGSEGLGGNVGFGGDCKSFMSLEYVSGM